MAESLELPHLSASPVPRPRLREMRRWWRSRRNYHTGQQFQLQGLTPGRRAGGGRAIGTTTPVSNSSLKASPQALRGWWRSRRIYQTCQRFQLQGFTPGRCASACRVIETTTPVIGTTTPVSNSNLKASSQGGAQVVAESSGPPHLSAIPASRHRPKGVRRRWRNHRNHSSCQQIHSQGLTGKGGAQVVTESSES